MREFERALASANKADQLSPVPLRPGLRSAVIMANACEALLKSNRRSEAREMLREARIRLRGFVEREPFLALAQYFLAGAAFNAARFARLEWKFDEFIAS